MERQPRLNGRDTLVLSHLDLVTHIAHGLAVGYPAHVDIDELIAAGNEGLVQAADRFNPTLGTPFNRFAKQRIQGAMIDALRAGNGKILRHLSRLHRAENAGTEPDKLADETGLTHSDIQRVRVYQGVPLSLNRLIDDSTDDTDVTLADSLTDAQPSAHEVVEGKHRLEYFAKALDLLPPAVKEIFSETVINRHRGQLDVIATRLGVSAAAVSQSRIRATHQVVTMMRHFEDPVDNITIARWQSKREKNAGKGTFGDSRLQTYKVIYQEGSPLEQAAQRLLTDHDGLVRRNSGLLTAITHQEHLDTI